MQTSRRDRLVEQILIFGARHRAGRRLLSAGALPGEHRRLGQRARQRPVFFARGRCGRGGGGACAELRRGAARRGPRSGARFRRGGGWRRRGAGQRIEQGERGAHLGGALHGVEGVVAREQPRDGLLQRRPGGARWMRGDLALRARRAHVAGPTHGEGFQAAWLDGHVGVAGALLIRQHPARALRQWVYGVRGAGVLPWSLPPARHARLPLSLVALHAPSGSV